jgi:hypothetical protein
MLRIDTYSFEKTAEVVYAINPSVRERFPLPHSLLRFMEQLAHEYQYETTSMGTYGFELTFFPSADKQAKVCKASVSPSLVHGYLREVDTVLSTEWQPAVN